MTPKYVKVHWKNVEDSTPRLITVDESTVIDGDFIEALESGTKNKVVRLDYYEPSPKYLLLGLTGYYALIDPSYTLQIDPLKLTALI